MKNIVAILLSGFLLSFSVENKNINRVEGEGTRFSYHIENGKLHGDYESFYANGQLKAKGRFEHNLRVGKWSVWDSTGQLKMQRVYTDRYTFETIVPKPAEEPPIQLLNVPQYKIERDERELVKYFHLHEIFVVWSKRVWKELTPSNNPILFENNRLYSVILNNLSPNQLLSYKNEKFSEINDITPDTSGYDLIAFRVKEDYFFDNFRMQQDSRVVGLAPLVIDRETKDTLELFWIYYPSLRDFLAEEKIYDKNVPSYIQQLDDVFFFSYFSNDFYKDMRFIKDPIRARFQEVALNEEESIEILTTIVESEHDYWLSFTE